MSARYTFCPVCGDRFRRYRQYLRHRRNHKYPTLADFGRALDTLGGVAAMTLAEARAFKKKWENLTSDRPHPTVL